MKLSSIFVSIISSVFLCSCAKTDQAMYNAYIEATKSNNSIERERLSQQGKTARAAILSQQGVIITSGNHSKKRSSEYLTKKALQNSLLKKVERRDNQWSIVPVSAGPPCSVVCADGCSQECRNKCPDLCDELEDIPDYVEQNEVSAHNEPEYKTQEEMQEMPAINVIGSTNVTINLGAGASTTSGENKDINNQVKLPKSVSHIATERAFSLGDSLIKWGSIFGIVDSVSDGISRISESPNYYVDNQGRNEVFDSRDQSTNGSFNGE